MSQHMISRDFVKTYKNNKMFINSPKGHDDGKMIVIGKGRGALSSLSSAELASPNLESPASNMGSAEQDYLPPKEQKVLEVTMPQQLTMKKLSPKNNQDLQKCSLETGNATQKGEDDAADKQPYDSTKGLQDSGKWKNSNLADEMGNFNIFFKHQRVSEQRRIFQNPTRVLDLYKKSFNKSSQFFQNHHGGSGLDQQRINLVSNSGQCLQEPSYQGPAGSQQMRAKTPSNIVSRNRKNYTNYLYHHKKGSVGVPYQSKQQCIDEHGFAIVSKFPKRSIPPHRQSLLLSKQSSISGQQNSQNQKRHFFSPNRQSTNLNGDLEEASISPLQVKKKQLQHTSIKSGKYDTLKAMNASETSKKLDDSNFNKVLRQPQVKMQPVVSKMGDFKSTLSNASFINRISSSRKDVSKGADVVISRSNSGASSASSDGQLNKWPTSPFSSKHVSRDIAVGDKSQKMLEIKGSDGDKVMILQFDKNQLQVFNDILERQMTQGANDVASSRDGDKLDDLQKIKSEDGSVSHSYRQAIAGMGGKQINIAKNIKLQQHQMNLQYDPSKFQAKKKAHSRGYAKNKMGLLQQTNDLQYILETPANGYNKLLGLDSASGSKSGSQINSPSEIASSPSSAGGRGGHSKKPIDLNKFMRNWQEESRISSPTIYDSPKHKFYLHAAMYHNQKRDRDQSGPHLIYARGSDADTTLNAAAISIERQRALSSPLGIPVKELRVDIRKPNLEVNPVSSNIDLQQPGMILTVQNKPPTIPVPQSQQKPHKRSKSFLQHLTEKFGPDLVGKYLMTKNLSSVRRLIKLEESQRCNCLYRTQLSELQQYYFVLDQQQQQKNDAYSDLVRQINSTTNVIQTQTSPRDQAKQQKKNQETEQKVEDEQEQEVSVALKVPMITAKPCKDCLAQNQFAGQLCKMYQKQVMQKLEPVYSNQVVAQAHGRLNNMTGADPCSKQSKLHHARYFKKPIEEKQLRDIKKKELLRKARNSKLLNVVSMNDVKSFDRHIQRCLTVKNDSIFHKDEIKKVGAEAGLLHPSILTKSTPELSNSILSNLDPEDTSKTGSVTHNFRASCDVSVLNIHRNETSSTPSLSPMPIMVLNPRQNDSQQPSDDGKSAASKQKQGKRSQKFFFFKGRNYSTLSRKNDIIPLSQNSTVIRDKLSRGSSGTKKSSHKLMNLSKAVQRQGAGLVQLSEVASKSTVKEKGTSVIQNGPLNAESGPVDTQQPTTEIMVNQLKAAAMMNRGGSSAMQIQGKKVLKPNEPQQLQSIGASTHLLDSARQAMMTPGSKHKKEINAVLDSKFDYGFNQGSSSYKQKRFDQKGRNLLQPKITNFTSKEEPPSPNSGAHHKTNSESRTRINPLFHSANSNQSHSKSGGRNKVGLSSDQDDSQVNFSTSQHVPRELAKFFRFARKSALKQPSFDSNAAAVAQATTQPIIGRNTSINLQRTEHHLQQIRDRKGLKTSENQTRAKQSQSNTTNSNTTAAQSKNNTRYCVTRQKASMLYNPSSTSLLNQLIRDSQSVQQKHGKRGRNKIAPNQSHSHHRVPILSPSVSKLSTNSRNQLRNSHNEAATAVEFKALKPTILTPSSAMSRNQPANIKLIVSRDLNGKTKATERCVKVNSRHIVVKDHPRQMKAMLYSSFLNSEKQEKFLLTDHDCAFFK